MDKYQWLKSISILLGISISIAYCGTFLLWPVIPVFIISSLVQFFAGDIITRIFAAKHLENAKLAELETVKALEQQYAPVKCPCDRNSQQLVMLNVNEENLYTCNTCQKDCKTLVGWKSFQVTTPVGEDPFKNFNFAENRDSVL